MQNSEKRSYLEHEIGKINNFATHAKTLPYDHYFLNNLGKHFLSNYSTEKFSKMKDSFNYLTPPFESE